MPVYHKNARFSRGPSHQTLNRFQTNVPIEFMRCINNTGRVLGLDLDALQTYHKATGRPIQFDASSTRFDINSTVETMAYEMFIESWRSRVSYERFFNSCAPTYCTYKYYYRFDTIELLTTLLSVYAGLSLVIRFVVPYLVKIIKKISNRCCNNDLYQSYF